MIFQQHIPNFVDRDRPEPAEFETLEDLLNFDCVANRKEDVLSFHQYSISGHNLLAEYHKGREWWVLGTIFGSDEEIETLGLPEWKSPSAKILDKHAAGQGNFDIAQNSETKLWEIFDRRKKRKIGACLKHANIAPLIAGYLEGEK